MKDVKRNKQPENAVDATAPVGAPGSVVRVVAGRISAFGLADSAGEEFYVEIKSQDGTTIKGRDPRKSSIPFFEKLKLDVGDAIEMRLAATGEIESLDLVRLPLAHGITSESAEREEDQINSFRRVEPDVNDPINTIRPVALPDHESDALDTVKGVAAQEEKPLATLLKGRFTRDAAGIYRRVGETREALADEGQVIRFIDKQMDAFEAGVELAKSKGWKAIEVTGTEKFRAEAWFHAKAAGLDVIGYEPNEQDFKRLKSQGKSITPHAEVLAPSKEMVDSQQEAFDIAMKKGLGVVGTNKANGRYAGKIIHETSHHLLQETGKGTVAVHDKRDLDPEHATILKASKSLKVHYNKGHASVASMDKSRATIGR
ncbi:LPD7 domain-containing protein [Undibacterium arcticum]|uniref:LPD7 domain-containing protein n=1 Tax=Undibacterium arcticum TaxID=1762892 RepID=A0ABV7F7B0_9BURK